MKDYSLALDYELELTREIQDKPISTEEFAVLLQRAWPKLQEPQNH
jgi:hypothetical protein